MKKNYYISLLLILFSITGFVSADECSNSCQISDAPAPALTEYFTNIQTLQTNILEVLSDAEADLPEIEETETSQVQAEGEEALNIGKRLLQSLNGLLSFNDHFGSFDYKIALPITNEIPNEVKRDHRNLENISERLSNMLETAHRRNTAGAHDDNICDGVSYCEIGEVSMGSILTTAIKNNREIIRLYESSILDKAYLAENRNFILVSSDFESQLQEYYNKDTLGSCSKCEGNSWSETTEKIKDISIINSEFKAGVQKWKNAWALLRGGNAAHNSAAENKALSQYLGTQGISGSQTDVILDNLDKYGSGSISGSNPLLNSQNYAGASIDNTIDTFSQTLSEQFEGRERVPIIELAIVNSDVKSTEDLSLGIKSLYEDQLPFAQAQDQGSQELQLRAARMHFSLVRSINELQKNKSLSEELCDKQGTGDGRCSY